MYQVDGHGMMDCLGETRCGMRIQEEAVLLLALEASLNALIHTVQGATGLCFARERASSEADFDDLRI